MSRFIRALLAGTALSTMTAVVSAPAQQTRSSMQQYDNQNITTNGHGAITGSIVNSMFNQIIGSAGTQPDANEWTGVNTFQGILGMQEPVLINTGVDASIAGAQGSGGSVITGNPPGPPIVPSMPGAGCNVGDRISPENHNSHSSSVGSLEGPAVFQVDTLTSAGPPITLTATFAGTNMIVTATSGVLAPGMYINLALSVLQPPENPGITISSGPIGGGPGTYVISSPLTIVTIANPVTFYAAGSVATMHMLYGGTYSTLPYLTPAAFETFGYGLNNCDGTQVTLVSNGVTPSSSFDGLQVIGALTQPGAHLEVNATGIASIIAGSKDIAASDAAISIWGIFGRNYSNQPIYYSSIQFVEANATATDESGRIQIGIMENGTPYQEIAAGHGVVIGSAPGNQVYNQDGAGPGTLSTGGYYVGYAPPTGSGFIKLIDGVGNATFPTEKSTTICNNALFLAAPCYSSAGEVDRGTIALTAGVTFTNGSSVIGWSGANPLTAYQGVIFSTTGSLPTGLSAGVEYFVLGACTPNCSWYPTPTAFYVGTTTAGPPIVAGSAGSGTQTAQAVNRGPITTNYLVSKDDQARKSSFSGTQTDGQLDLITAGPDDSAIRVMYDMIAQEQYGPSPDGVTAVAHGVRVRPASQTETINGSTAVSTGPTRILKAFEATSSSSFPGSYINYALYADSSYLGMYLVSAAPSAVTTADAPNGTNTLTFLNVGGANPLAGIKVGDYICTALQTTPPECASGGNIPQNDAVTAIASSGATTTVTLTTGTTGDVPPGTTLYGYSVFQQGIYMSGAFSIALETLVSQYGIEFSVLNGVRVGVPSGSSFGAGTLNVAGLYYANGVAGVSCAANTISLTTATVTNGILTHC